MIHLPAKVASANRSQIARPCEASRRRNDRAELRARLADAVEGLLAVLDAVDGDPEAEDDGIAEPSLGWTRTMAWGCGDDREEDQSASLWGD